MTSVTRLVVSAPKRDAGPSVGAAQRGSVRDTIDGPAAMTISNAITGALKQSCGKGPTKVKAYNTHDDLAIVVQDMLTTLERTLVHDGHEQLVREARRVLIERVPRECRSTIEQATGRLVVGWQTE